MTIEDASALAGKVEFATPQNNASLSRQVAADRALRLARGVYVTGTALPAAEVAYFHRFTIIEHVWPGAVLCGVTALNAGEVADGYMFVAHPRPDRTGKLELPGLTVQPQIGPGPLHGDVEVGNGLWMSGLARRLVENVNLRGRPGRSQAGTGAVRSRIEQLAGSADAELRTVLEDLDQIAGQFDDAAVQFVLACLEAALSGGGTAPTAATDDHIGAAGTSASPYSTGGGGVTLERRVAVSYLTKLLIGTPAPELSEVRAVTGVAFQQAPQYAADDLVIRAADPKDPDDIAEMPVAIRRTPRLLDGDAKSEQLIVQLLRVTTKMADYPQIRTVALVVAGQQSAASQLALLAHHARRQPDADRFYNLLNTPGKFNRNLRGRLEHIEKLVRTGLRTLRLQADDAAAKEAVFELLCHLAVLQPRLEAPDDSDWGALIGQLIPASRGQSPQAAAELRDRIEALTASYAPTAADIDKSRLRRDAHDLLESTYNRNVRAWKRLGQLDTDWRASVRREIGAFGGAGHTCHLNRAAALQAVRSAIDTADTSLIVHGQSGVGKSALITAAVDTDPAEAQVLGMSLRHLPETPVELTALLGVPLATALQEMSAPRRVLVIDGADAAAESSSQMLTHVLAAARTAGVVAVIVVAADALSTVRDAVTRAVGQVAQHEVAGLDDEEIGSLIEAFPQLRRLGERAQSRELLRRLAVADYLARADSSGVLLSDADAMGEVWHRVVRRGGRSDHGQPDARERVLRQLARQQLDGQDAETVLDALDTGAVAGLRRDGLLRPAANRSWQQLPVFDHDLLRTYALAQLLLVSGRPAEQLAWARAPRWALSAARLACQAILVSGGSTGDALGRRFTELQQQFETLAADGFGDRWADVPTEALLTAGCDGATLSSAWSALTTVPGVPERMLRLLDQQHRHRGVLDPLVAGPVIECLLDHSTVPAGTDAVGAMVRDLEFALIIGNAPSGHPLRLRLREQLVRRCGQASKGLAEQQQASQQKLAARTPEEIAAEGQRKGLIPSRSGLPFGPSRRRKRTRSPLPRELTDALMLEQLALLGRDLGKDGEQLLRDVAEHAPHRLAPAVEEAGTGRALAEWNPKLLCALTEAYYIEEPDEQDLGFLGGIHDDGIRDHRWRGPVTPLAAYYRGSFLPMLQADFVEGIVVINKMLNTAARVRVAGLAALAYGQVRQQNPGYGASFVLDGAERRFTGDPHVWSWYRGHAVGPYPCVSALQALEVVCDQYIAAGVRLGVLVPLLLRGCENLAMVGLTVGMLIRHADAADTALDPFFSEPEAWDLEFTCVMGEYSMLAAGTPVTNPERRRWSLREAAMWLVLHADTTRAEQLRLIGERLEARARVLLGREAPGTDNADERAGFGASTAEKMATIRGWAATLDRGRYQAEQLPDGNVQIQPVLPDDVVATLQPSNAELARSARATSLITRYAGLGKTASIEPVESDELANDIKAARDLLADPPENSPGGAADGPVAVAAYAVEAALVRRDELDMDDLLWAARTLLLVAKLVRRYPLDRELMWYSWGADRSAARGLPGLLLPQAAEIRSTLGLDSKNEPDRLYRALRNLAADAPLEARLSFAKALDPVWLAPCSAEPCHHRVAFRLVEDSARDCALGAWNSDQQRHERQMLKGTVTDAIKAVTAGNILLTHLSPAIRAAAPGSLNGCCKQDAAGLLGALLDAHCRGITYEDQNQDSADDALVVARALLTVASGGNDSLLHQHLTALSDHVPAMAGSLEAISAAAEENPAMGATARRLWPAVMNHVLDHIETGHLLVSQSRYGPQALTALLPAAAYDAGYLGREIDGQPHPWTTPLEWKPEIERWLPHAAGQASCVDALIRALTATLEAEQAAPGLPWVESLIAANPEAAAHQSLLLPQWLRDIRGNVHGELMTCWQRIVDALIVTGDSRVSDLAD